MNCLTCFGPVDGVAAVAVVLPTVVRPSLERSLECIYAQVGIDSIQILIGVDKPQMDSGFISAVLERRPAHVSALLLELPYSTSARHEGIHSARDGGALRAILTLMAHSRHVAYLDDDNTWTPDHLSRLLEAIRGKAWAFSHRFLIDEDTGENYGPDVWHSVGVDKGVFSAQGGFVDPNCLMVDTLRAAPVIGRWASSGSIRPGAPGDRYFFAGIRRAPHGVVKEPTVYYKVRKTNALRHLAMQREQDGPATDAAGDSR
jgi:hypothetical protein